MADQRNRLLVGQVALDLGFVTPKQLQECLELQAGQGSPRPIGEVFVKNGTLTPGQWDQVLAEQGRRLAESVPFSSAPKDAMSFGRLLVREGYTPLAMVDQALRAQQDMAERGSRKRLGEILVESGHLAPRDVHRALWYQGKAILACLPCGTRTNVLVVLADQFPCKRCGMTLTPEGEAVSADESAYQVPVVQTRLESAPVPPQPRSPLQVGLMTLLGAVVGGAVVFMAMKAEQTPPAALSVRQEPSPVPPAPVAATPPPVPPRPVRRLIVELSTQVRPFECQVGIVSVEGIAEAQQVLRDTDPPLLSFDTLSAGAKHVALLPRSGVLPVSVSVWLPESGDLRVKLELKASLKLTGTVIDDARRPVTGARVTYTLPDFLPAVGDRQAAGLLFMGAGNAAPEPATSSTLGRSGVLRISTSTDHAGRFTLDGMSPAPLTLKVSSGRITQEFSGLKAAEPATIRLPARQP